VRKPFKGLVRELARVGDGDGQVQIMMQCIHLPASFGANLCSHR
jgi:hypothetical protein